MPDSHDVSAPVLPYPIHPHRLANDLLVVTVPFDSPGLAAFYIVVRVGSRNEVEQGVTGFAHFFEHMMFRGTDRYPKERYESVLKSIGASANANTSADRTEYHMTGNADKLEKMFEIEADRFQNLNYSPHDFKIEAGAVKGEYTKNYANPYTRLREKMLGVAFVRHPYQHTTMGFYEDIVDMPNQYDYSRKFFDRYYRPEHCTVIVVGDVTPERVQGLAEKYFGGWKRGSHQEAIPEEPEQKETRRVHLQEANVPPLLSLNYKAPAFDDHGIEMPALDVLSTVLFSEQSELYRKLVIQEQKVRSLGGGALDSRDPNLFVVQALLLDSKDMRYVCDTLIGALERVANEGVDEKALADTKSHLKYSFAMRIDSPDAIARSLSHYIQLTGDPDTINRLYAQYDRVSAEDVRRVAARYLVPDRLTVATVSGDEKGEPLP